MCQINCLFSEIAIYQLGYSTDKIGFLMNLLATPDIENTKISGVVDKKKTNLHISGQIVYTRI